MSSNRISEQVIFKTIYGSKLYGTDGPKSDVDIIGVFLPSMESCLLCKAPQHYLFKPETVEHGPDREEESWLSLQYFMGLLTQGETNCLDMFFAYTNKSAVLETSDAYKELIDNRDKFITSNVTKYLGYCKSQALKYSIKGDRIANYEAFMKLIDSCTSPSSTTLGEWLVHLRIMGADSGAPLGDPEDYFKNNTHIGKRFKITDNRLGDHAYLLLCDNKERYIMVSGHLFPQNANINSTKDSINKCLKSYGKRAFNAAEDNGADYKALSHALRVAYQAQDLLVHGEIRFPLDELQLKVVRDIKFKQTTMSYDEIVELIEQNIETVESCLKTTSLPSKPDWDWINNFILKQYGEQQ